MGKISFDSWLAAGAIARGRGHIKHNVVCQDKVFCTCRKGVTIAALADGAGSATNSHVGAEITVNIIAHFLADNFQAFYDSCDAGQVAEEILSEIRNNLQQMAYQRKLELGSLASTLLVVAVSEEKYILLHLGDGMIGCFCQDGIKAASLPVNGEFANSTVFTTSEHAASFLRMYKGILKDIDGFVLMSDGAAQGLYSKASHSFAGALRSLAQMGRLLPQSIMQKILSEELLPALIAKTTDDCSVAFLLNRNGAGQRPSSVMIERFVEIWQYLQMGYAPRKCLQMTGIHKKYHKCYMQMMLACGWIEDI